MFAKLCLLLILSILILPFTGIAQEYQCDVKPKIIVETSQHGVVEAICETAEKTISFLTQYQLQPKRAIRIHVVEGEIISEGYHAFGIYDIRSEVIELMSYRAIFDYVDHPEMYGEPFDEIYYSGAVAHEVTHAVVQHNLLTKHISQAPQEYLAHATQLAVLPAERRNRIIKAMDVGPWEPGDAISDIYMAIEPGKFAVKSYLHLIALEKPEEFVQILMKANWFYVYVP